MSSYTLTAVATVAVAVAGAEVSRLAAIKHNADHPRDVRPVIGTMSPVLGGFALGLFLFAAGIASERLATMFCLLIVVASLLVNGQALFSVLTPSK